MHPTSQTERVIGYSGNRTPLTTHPFSGPGHDVASTGRFPHPNHIHKTKSWPSSGFSFNSPSSMKTFILTLSRLKIPSFGSPLLSFYISVIEIVASASLIRTFQQKSYCLVISHTLVFSIGSAAREQFHTFAFL